MKKQTHRQPPIWVENLLELFIQDYFLDETLGDLYEWYQLNQHLPRYLLTIKYFLLAIRSLRPYRLKKTQKIFLNIIDISMLNNDLKVGIRSIFKNLRFSLINLLGLTTAFTCTLFIYSYVSHENSFHDYHPKTDQIYSIVKQSTSDGSLTRYTTTPLVPALQNEFPGSATFARIGQDPVYIHTGKSSFYEANFYWADPTLLSIFDFEFLYGSASASLNVPNSIVLTEQSAVKYFGEGVDPVGKTLDVKIYDGDLQLSMRVSGVLKKFPSNQDFPFEILGSMSNALEIYSQFENSWGLNWLLTYALFERDDEVAKIEARSNAFFNKYMGQGSETDKAFFFQPIKEIHLFSQHISRSHSTGNYRNVLAIVAIGIFIVLIAGINYINMVTARLHKRGKEVGIRKFNGATKYQLIKQFLTESGLIVFVSALVSYILAYVLWQPFTLFISTSIPIETLLSPSFVIIYLGLALVLTLAAGGYPAWLLSSLDMLKMIRGIHKKISRAQLRRILVIVQFGISAFLIICTLVIWDQINFMSNKSLGFNQEQLVVIPVESKDLQARIDVIKNEVSNLPGVASATISSESLPSEMNNRWGISWNPDERMGIYVVSIGIEYFETLEINLLMGENLSLPFKTDSARSIIINESAREAMNLENPIGQMVTLGGIKRKIVGVVNDYHYQSLHEKTESVAFMVGTSGYRVSQDNLIVRLHAGDITHHLRQINEIWESLAPNDIFNFQFVDQAFQQTYDNETSFIQLLGIFSLISILIASIGLFGMVVFMTEERSKELSIRKVLGAGIPRIIMQVAGEFTLLVFIGYIIALPIGIFTSENWMDRFPYRADFDFSIILLAALLLLLMAWLTIGYNTIKTALSNPVKFLRNE